MSMIDMAVIKEAKWMLNCVPSLSGTVVQNALMPLAQKRTDYWLVSLRLGE